MSIERLKKRGQSLAPMGLVEWEGNGLHSYSVATPSLRGRQTKYRVAGDWKSASCTCLDWEANKTTREYFCEHKWALYFYLQRDEQPFESAVADDTFPRPAKSAAVSK